MKSDNSIWDTQTPQTKMVPVGELPKVTKGDSLEFTFTVQELDAATGTDFPAFTATLASYGGFWGWDQTTGEDDSWKVTVNAPGEYTISVTAPADWEYSGAFSIDTNLEALPAGYAICGKTAKLGSKTYDWSSAELYNEGNYIIRFGIWNEFEYDKKSNPLMEWQYTESWMEEEWVTAEEWTAPVNKYGDITVKGTAVRDATSQSGALYLDTDLTRMPQNYSIIGKTLKIEGKEYDWSGAKAYRNTTARNVRLSLWDAEDDDEYANPITESISIRAGDVIEATFSVTDEANPNPDFIATLMTNFSIQTPDLKVAKGDTLEFTFTVTAPKNADEKDFPSFTATLTSYGGFWGWDATTGEDDSWKVTVNAPGEYTIRVTAPADWEYSGAFCVETDLTALPSGYAITGKTAVLGEETYDWHSAEAYIDVDTIRLGIWNEWQVNSKGNPLLADYFKYFEDEAMRTAMVREFGDYTLKITAPQDADSHSGTFTISTDLNQIPSHYSIVGKTVKIGDKTYDWSNALPYKYNGIRLSLWDVQSNDKRANPIAEDITIKKGDVIEATFSVTDEPYSAPDFTATLASNHSIWDTRTPEIQTQPLGDAASLSIKKGDSLEFHFTVKALDDTTKEDFPSFTATLTSYGGFWGWNQFTSEDDSWKMTVNAPGEYAFCVTAPADWDFSGAFRIDTNLTKLPSGVAISGSTAKLGDKTYDWHSAKAYVDGDSVCLSIWNEWAGSSVYANPLLYKYTEDWMSEDWVTAEEWTTAANTLGDHTLKGIATQDATSHSGALSVETDLTEIPQGYTVSGKTVKIAGKEYDWSKAKLYRKSDGTIALSLWDAEDSSENANPLGEDIEIKAGDELEVTFIIQKADVPLQTSQPTDSPVPTVTAEPTGTPAPAGTAEPTGTPEPIRTSEPTGTPEPTGTSEPAGTPAPTDALEPTKTPDSTKKPEPGNTKKPTSLAKNKTFTSGSFKYKVTVAAKNSSPAKVSVIGLSPAGKKTSSINVKNTVSYSGISYKVTAIGSSAFKNSAKLTKATLGTNIGSIPANGFSGCRKLTSVAALGITKINQSAFKNCTTLKKLTLREKISVKKGAFKGCKKTIKVTGSSQKVNKANVKKLKKCGYKKFK